MSQSKGESVAPPKRYLQEFSQLTHLGTAVCTCSCANVSSEEQDSLRRDSCWSPLLCPYCARCPLLPIIAGWRVYHRESPRRLWAAPQFDFGRRGIIAGVSVSRAGPSKKEGITQQPRVLGGSGLGWAQGPLLQCVKHVCQCVHARPHVDTLSDGLCLPSPEKRPRSSVEGSCQGEFSSSANKALLFHLSVVCSALETCVPHGCC